MSAYRRSAEIQQYGCTALSPFATVRPTPKSKAPLRESAIQVLTESLTHHTDNIDVVQAACQLIATVAEVMVHIPSWCIEQEFTAEETEQLCQTADNILACIKDGVVDRLGEISRRYAMAQQIKISVTKLMACFGCYSSSRSCPADPNGFRPKAFSFPVSVKEKHVSFAQKLETITSEKGGSLPSVRTSSLDIGPMQRQKSETKDGTRQRGRIELEEESIQTDEDQEQDDRTRPGAFDDDHHPSRDEKERVEEGESLHQSEQQEDVEKQEQRFHHPHEECKHPTNRPNHLTDKDRSDLIEEAWRFLDETYSPHDSEYYEDDILLIGMESELRGENESASQFDLSEMEKDGLLAKEDEDRDVDMEQENGNEHQWDCLFTSPYSNRENNDIKDDIDNNNGDEGDEEQYQCYYGNQISQEMTERGEEMEEDAQSQIYSTLSRENRTLEDATDEMSDGVYSYDVQQHGPDDYSVYSEFDIMEALIKAGLLNETDNKPSGLPKFPVDDDDSILGDGDNAEHHLQSHNNWEDSTVNSRYTSSKSKTWNRVPSHYENVEEEAESDAGQVRFSQPSREINPESDFKQASFDSGLDDAEGGALSSSGEEVDSSNRKGENDIHESRGMSEWGASRRKEEDKGYIDECYRMSRLSIMLDDLESLTWHENAAFNAAVGNAPHDATADETDTYVEEDARPERERLESHSSSQSCSSGSYTIQPISRLMECRSLGSLDHLCNLRETQSVCELSTGQRRKRTDVLKTMSCSNVDMVPPPPKPRRTWYYQSSWDVRRSLVRSFGPNYDGYDNPIYDEPPPPDLYATVSKPLKKDRQQDEPTYAKVQKKHLSPSSSESSNIIHKSGTASSNDSGVVLLANKIYKSRAYSHLYEDIEKLNVKSNGKTDMLSRYLEEDSSEATYEVCTLWVNRKYTEALDTFNHLTQRLASLYSIVPEARKEESRRSALLYDMEDLEDDYPAWANILNVLASDEGHWTLKLAVRVLPIVDRLFQVEDKNVLNAVIELVQVLVRRYGRDITKNRNPSLFKTKFREDCRECFTWLSKLNLRTEFLLMKRKEAERPDWDCLLHSSLLDSFSKSLQPFNKSR